jgi:hypothetical protein
MAHLASALADGGTLVLETPLTIDYGKLEERYGDIYHTLFFDHFTLSLLLAMHGFRCESMRNLMFYLPEDWSAHLYVQGAFRRAGTERHFDLETIRMTRRAYDGLNGDAMAWAHAHLALRSPHRAAVGRVYRSFNGKPIGSARWVRLLAGARSLKRRLDAVRGDRP